ncbi:MAG: cyclodeaminase/cyclohydrolase family protein [Berryella intestinalis]|uniref:cyclodeaminase/cyclohydrolase family protein n=1 Tax=Berryella intestinalis TaxID=1531429 RepID=UPI002A747B81|nr:cyclodeaminase/cyclohydrolase family protein [Berryella intestinalis]MDY3129219.1 cyclodeaminase/cyclohydrolase family protein [Berryella intestinalis]
MTFRTNAIDDFSLKLASKDAVPGGGGAAALAGALGCDLAGMVGNLTVGKKKYADVEAEAAALVEEAVGLSAALKAAIDADAEAFAPLSRAYGIAKDDPDRERIMEAALKTACTPPLDIMRLAARGIAVHARMAQIGSRLALSDVGAGAALCKAALQSASLSVFINTRSMTDRTCADQLESEADELLATYGPLADETLASVMDAVRSPR